MLSRAQTAPPRSMQHQSCNKRSSIFITSSMKGPTICTGVGNIKREKVKSKEYLFRKVMQKWKKGGRDGRTRRERSRGPHPVDGARRALNGRLSSQLRLIKPRWLAGVCVFGRGGGCHTSATVKPHVSRPTLGKYCTQFLLLNNNNNKLSFGDFFL